MMFNFKSFQSKIRNIDGGAHGKVRKLETVNPDEERVPEPAPAPASSPVEELRVKVPEVVEEPEEESKVELPVLIEEESLYR